LARLLHCADLEARPMKNRNRAMLPGLVVAVALLLSTWPVAAHHEMVAQFSMNSPITLRGRVTKVEWVNPHGWIYLDIKGADGRVGTWAVETGSPFKMTKRGLKPAAFQYGTEDMIGAFSDFRPRFVKRYAEVGHDIAAAAQAYASDVRARRFPAPEHCFGAAKATIVKAG